jgi:hypothetical protein|tara:strand:+ start:700 stop:852 length:153 start_codon:yes stop_codon:yes gene_type:complete
MGTVTLNHLAEAEIYPAYISIENGMPKDLSTLHNMGYKHFKFSNQRYNHL